MLVRTPKGRKPTGLPQRVQALETKVQTLETKMNKIKLVSHRAFGFRRIEHYVAALCHGCARLRLPTEA